MKHSRELELMMDAFRRSGIPVSGMMVHAMEIGLKHIRMERYKERKKSRQGPGRADGGKAGIKLADRGITSERMAADPQLISDTEQRSLESRFPVFADPERYVEEPRRL